MHNNITELLKQKHHITSQLEHLTYGAIEKRTKDGRAYLYLNFRINGIKKSKYIGIYDADLVLKINKNNILAKKLKRELRTINKELDALGFIDDKLNEHVKLNLDLARHELVKSIYNQAVLEGIATTYSNTETIVNGGKVNGMSVTDINKTLNLKRAWNFILDEDVITCPTDFSLVCQINRIIEDGFSYSAGRVRNISVSISGTNYIPPFPDEICIMEKIKEIINSKQDLYTKTALLLIYVMKTQMFVDGNKRTAVLFANHFLIKNGGGIITIPESLIKEFRTLLIKYYETDKTVEIVNFLVNKCLTKLIIK